MKSSRPWLHGAVLCLGAITVFLEVGRDLPWLYPVVGLIFVTLLVVTGLLEGVTYLRRHLRWQP